MSKRCVAALAIVTLARGVPVSASDTTGHFAVERIGQTTCSQFTAARAAKSPTYNALMGFSEGYVTAANRYELNTYDLSPWHSREGVAMIISGYCGAHGSDHFVSALEKMVSAMRPIRLAEFSPSVTVVDSGKQTQVYQTILKRAQSALHRQGRYSGPEDGRDSPQLHEAFRAFQKASNLLPTGLPDSATLWKLLNP